jgi:hypothetical protein
MPNFLTDILNQLALSTAINGIATNIADTAVAALPAIIGIIAIKKGIKFMMSLIKGA